LRKRSGSRRNSTISSSSARASSTPATSSQRTLESERGSIDCGFVFGMSRMNFHVSQISSPRRMKIPQFSRNV